MEQRMVENLAKIFHLLLWIEMGTSRQIDASSDLLSSLQGLNSPIILVVDSNERGSSNVQSLINGLVSKNNDELQQSIQDNGAAALYDFLRSEQQQQVHDTAESTEVESEDAAKYLRQALIMRCQSLNKCQKKCPKLKKYECQMSCQEVFDEEDMCNEPKESNCKAWDPCSKGKTMPPSWKKFLRSRLN